MKPPSVYLSNPGLVCCAGKNREEFFAAALRGDRRGVIPLSLRAGGMEQTFLVGRAEPGAAENSRGARLRGLCAAALEQIRPAAEKALGRWGPERVGVCTGSCDNGTEWSLPAHRTFFETGAFPKNYDLRVQGAAAPAEYGAAFFGLRGPVLALATACASSATAIIRGAELIRSGICDAVIAGGADIASDMVLLGFTALEAVSPEPCNPFSKNRRGINLGEGAAFFVLSREKLEAPAIVLAGYGESADGHHLTAPHPEGAGAVKAMEGALARGGLTPEDISYVNLHGTGTVLNDRAEALAMRRIFGDKQPPAGSSKPITGHTLGAAGTLELALCWSILNIPGTLPPHCWDGVQDPELPVLRLTGPAGIPGASEKTNRPAPARRPPLVPQDKIQYCMSNSFAFGGCNVSLILGREKAAPHERNKGNRY